MARKSKRQIIEENTTILGVEFRCGACGEKVIAKVEAHNFSASESPCELCGGHGNINVDLVCPKCSYRHDIEISSW